MVLAPEHDLVDKLTADAQRAVVMAYREQAARATFEDGSLSTDLPTFDIARAELASGLRLTAALVRAELVASNGEAKRQITQRSIRVNDEVITDELANLSSADATNGVIKLSLGKKKHALLRPI